jgi:4-deoxy-L-threo-5-hexosulose-uronate ketol-isomerase
MSTQAATENATLRSLRLPGVAEVDLMTTAQLRESFLVEHLFEPGRARFYYTDLDRLIIAGIVPTTEIRLPAFRELGTRYFNERREIGIFNIGSASWISVGQQTYTLECYDCLYIGTGEEEVRFHPPESGAPPIFYLASCPAHRFYPTARLARAQARAINIGDEFHAACRTIYQYIHPGGIPSCQLVMGMTVLAPNSVWNTMPAHTHERRSEIYLYLDLEDRNVVHLMGAPDATRHLIVRDRQAVLSPPWSIHAGAGTGNYSFIWAMAGENQDFADIDMVEGSQLF